MIPVKARYSWPILATSPPTCRLYRTALILWLQPYPWGTTDTTHAGVAYDSGTGKIYVAIQGYDAVRLYRTAPMPWLQPYPRNTPQAAGVAYGVAYDSGKGEIFVTHAGVNTSRLYRTAPMPWLQT